MTDREKVIEAFEMSYRYSNVDEDNTLVPQQLVLDTLALLKAQEPVEPKWQKGYAYCGKCGYKLHWIVEQNNFCPNCGQEVKWDG